MFACFLDASKAFDRINHCTLFGKMLAMGCEPFIVRILIAWYRMQRLCVRWGNVISDFFTVSCGVRQGSVLSPVLFNMYMNGLQLDLNASLTGCHVGNVSVNNISYADDMVLLSPSAKGLNKLLVICKEYASKHDIIYNTSKTKVMLFPCKSFVIAPALPVHIGDVNIEWVVEYLYLGYVIVPSLDDDRVI